MNREMGHINESASPQIHTYSTFFIPEFIICTEAIQRAEALLFGTGVTSLA